MAPLSLGMEPWADDFSIVIIPEAAVAPPCVYGSQMDAMADTVTACATAIPSVRVLVRRPSDNLNVYSETA
ncbi:MAG: hypothetical protein P4L33_09890 [Capsulimonadaceae bacterium]|nr:hypothetical protein [Capsulimonadaceae bacterium]